MDAGLAAGGQAVPHECRHHRRTAPDEGAASSRAGAGGGRGGLRAGAGAGRHVRLCRPPAALRRRQGAGGDLFACDRRRSQGAGLWRRAAAAVDLPGREGARNPAGSVEASEAAGRGAGVAAHTSLPLDAAAGRQAAGRGLPAWRQAVPGRLLLRGPQRAPDLGHAADAAHGAYGPAAAGLRGHRLCAGPLGVAAGVTEAARRAVRRGHAGRRSRSVDGRIEHAAALVPQRRGDRGPDRKTIPGRGEVAPPGHVQFGPDLRHAAPARARPYPAARHPSGRRLAACGPQAPR